MKIHKQAAIKTLLTLLSFFILITFLSFILINIPSTWILPILGIILLCIITNAIYKVILSDIKWEEQCKKREQEWKRLDEERYRKTLHEQD